MQKRQRNVQKVRCTRKVVVLPPKPIVVFDVLVVVASWDLYVPTVYRLELYIEKTIIWGYEIMFWMNLKRKNIYEIRPLYHMNNYANLDIDLHNSSYHYQPHPIAAVSIMYRKASYLPSPLLHSLPLHSAGTNFSIMYFSSSNSSSWITLFLDEAMVVSSLRSVPLPTPTEMVSMPFALICCVYWDRSSSWSVFFPSVKKTKSFVTF